MTIGMNCWRRNVVLFAAALLCLTAATWRNHSSAAVRPARGEIVEPPISENARFHWSFSPLKRPAVPKVQHANWNRNPIDAFIAQRLATIDLDPAPPADRETLLRRLSFDLLGLPPTPATIDHFLSDRSPDAYERLVERYLASPHYGERWAQHWLDLARFAETDGFEHDKVRSDAWRYRDWVIAAFNADMPYDRFVRLQLAGDELNPTDKAARIATAFCLSGPDMPDINSIDERKHNLLNEMTSTVGAVFLGLQIGCAQCHDHKYDPISQADFYRLRAVFEPAVNLQKNESVSVLSENGSTGQPSYLMIRGDWRRRGPQLSPAFPRIANPRDVPLEAGTARAGSGGRRTALADWLTMDDHILTSRVMANRLWQHHFGEGLSRTPSDFGVMGDEPADPLLLDWLATELVRGGWSLKHLHRLIVTSATYRQAGRFEFSSDLATAKANRQLWEARVAADPENRFLSRFPRRRLEGEVIRDAMLAAAEVLNTQQGGAGVRPPLPAELRTTLLKGQWDVTPDRGQHDRRSIYVFARRNLRYPIFEVFDRPAGNATCPRRDRSTTALQSLLMLNSSFSLDAARRIAGYVLQSCQRTNQGCEPDAIHFTFRRLFGRCATEQEFKLASDFLNEQTELVRRQGAANSRALPAPTPSGVDPNLGAAFVDLCLGLLNSSEFIYID